MGSPLAHVYMDGQGEVARIPVKRDSIGNCFFLDFSKLKKKTSPDDIPLAENETTVDLCVLDEGYKHTAACISKITYIDGDNGILLYRGYPIDQLTGTFLENSFLLLFGELPNKNEFDGFKSAVLKSMPVHPGVLEKIRDDPEGTHPMEMVIPMLHHLPVFYKKDDPKTDEGQIQIAINLIGMMPTLVAAAIRKSRHVGDPKDLVFIEPDPNRGYVENFLRMCFAKDNNDLYTPDPLAVAILNSVFTLHADHEQNASTTTVRQVCSTNAHPYYVFGSGLDALSGTAHGGANEEVLKMLKEISDAPDPVIDFDSAEVREILYDLGVKPTDTINEGVKKQVAIELKVNAFVDEVVNGDGEKRLMGFGHRVYKTYDPRAKIIKGGCDEVLEAFDVTDDLFRVATALERAARSNEHFIQRKLFPNVDFYSGIIFSALGFDLKDFTPLFALARASGWAAQYLEIKENKIVALYRPRQNYVGKSFRDYISMDDRPSSYEEEPLPPERRFYPKVEQASARPT